MANLHVYANRHIKDQVHTIKKGDTIYLENHLSRKRWALYFKINNIDENALDVTYITQEEFFQLEGTKDNMKFDAVVGNPPYQKRTWFKFVEKMISLQPKIISSINPDPTDNQSDFGEKWRKLCRENGLIHRKDVTCDFPNVSSGRISSFIFDTTQKANENLLVDSTKLIHKILEKTTTNNPTSFVIRGSQAVSGYGDKSKIHDVVTEKDKIHIYPSIMSCGNTGLVIQYSNKKIQPKKHVNEQTGRFVIMNRFFGKNNPDPVAEIDNIENYNLSYDCLAFKLTDNETIENFMSVYGGTLYRRILNEMRNGAFDIGQGNFMRLKRVDLTRSWTDVELYKHFNLTQEEIDYIESTVK